MRGDSRTRYTGTTGSTAHSSQFMGPNWPDTQPPVPRQPFAAGAFAQSSQSSQEVIHGWVPTSIRRHSQPDPALHRDKTRGRPAPSSAGRRKSLPLGLATSDTPTFPSLPVNLPGVTGSGLRRSRRRDRRRRRRCNIAAAVAAADAAAAAAAAAAAVAAAVNAAAATSAASTRASMECGGICIWDCGVIR